MIVPFVFNMSSFQVAPYLWWFYKGLEFARRTRGVIIAQEIYCTVSPSEFIKSGRPEAYYSSYAKALLYSLPKNSDQKYEGIYCIPDSILEGLIKKNDSVTEACYSILSHPYNRLCDFLENLIYTIELRYEKIEAFITLMEIPSLTIVAQRMGIAVIHFELGCLRYPNYINTAYWDLEPIYGGHSIEKRWQAFSREKKSCKVYSKKECLNIMLQPAHRAVIREYGRKPSKKIGVLTGPTDYELYSYKSRINDSELLFRISKKYGMQNMLVRRHPGDPVGAMYPRYQAAMDVSGHSIFEFLLQCETIISLMSGGCVEGMLFGKKVITVFPSPAYYAAGHDIEGEGKIASDDYMSFFCFSYLIPLEYLLNKDYCRWRLSNPSEVEIYHRHLDYYIHHYSE